MQPRYGLGVFSLFTTGVHTALLGGLVSFATTRWYSAYSTTTAVWGLSPLEDQQLGGLIMWIPGGLIYLAAALVLTALWISAAERSGQRLPDSMARTPGRAG